MWLKENAMDISPNIARNIKPALWGAVGGAIVAIVVGFAWGGWVTGGSAEKMAKNQADAAVVAVVAPLCVERFQMQPNAAAQLATLKAASSYQQAKFVTDGGWATMKGNEKPLSGTAQACADLLLKLAQ